MAPDLTAPNPSKLITTSTRTAHRPASERVAGILAERIRSGLYGTGELFPTERVLAADLGVHRRSVRTAINHLVRDGLVSHRPNCRPTVSWSPHGTSAHVELPSDVESRDNAEQVDNAERAESAYGRNRSKPPRISTSNLIALIMWHGGGPLEHAGTSQQRIFWGMNQSLMKVGYHAVFLDLGGRIGSEEENAAREAKHLRYIQDQGFGGALFYPYAYRHNRDLVQEISRDVPLVLLDRRIPSVNADFVGIENHRALFETTQHLIAQGHRRIAHLTRNEPIQSVQDRIQGYIDAMRSEAAPGMTEMVLHVPPPRNDHSWTVVDAVFRLPKEERPTAVVCVSDYMAVDLAERLEYLGLSIPRDVALTGFDNIVPTLPNNLGLTTVAQPYEDIGTTAVELLLRRIRDRHALPMSVELPARLILRESSAF